MNSYRKVETAQLFGFWKNLSTCLLAIIAMMAFTKLLPFYFSPAISIICAAALYTLMYQQRQENKGACTLLMYGVFYCLINYSFVTIFLNIAVIWGYIDLPVEIIFFSEPYVPALLMMPISALTMIGMYIRRKKQRICMECKLQNGPTGEQGMFSKIVTHETHFQIRNLALIFSILSVLEWVYYLFIYERSTMTSRDWYVFTWLVIIVFILDEIYFIMRYYNLYLDLQENNEIIDDDDIEDVTSKTYVRYYVICGNSMYLDPHSIDPDMAFREVIDTPFLLKRNVTGMTVAELRRSIEQQTGVENAEMRFFFGRRLQVGNNQSLIRYFYFLDGAPDDYPQLKLPGQWVDFSKIKQLYTNNPSALGPVFVADITRLATIMLTQKTFDEDGFRKNKIKKYKPTLNLIDVRNANTDFQDDKWINISLFNSDIKFYRLKRWWRKMSGRSVNDTRQLD